MSTTYASRSQLLIVIGWLLLLASCSAPGGHPSAHRTLPSQTVKPSFVYREQSSGLLSLAWSPDGKQIVSGSGRAFRPSQDHTARVWDASTGETSNIYRGHTEAITGLAWSPDGKRIASASKDGTVQIWDSTTDRKTRLDVHWPSCPGLGCGLVARRQPYCVGQSGCNGPGLGRHHRKACVYVYRPYADRRCASLVPDSPIHCIRQWRWDSADLVSA